MRLASCIAIELGTLLLVGVCGASGVLWGLGYLRPAEVQAAEIAYRHRPEPEPPLLRQRVAMEPPSRWDGPIASGHFHGRRDTELLEPLITGTLKSVKFNRGGSSISLRLTFEDGSRAAFKPRQTNLHTIPRREVAAYRLSRLLGLSSVQPAVGRAFPAEEIFAKTVARSQRHLPRMREEILVEDGMIVGEMSWWIPVIRPARIDGFPIDSVEGIVTFRRYLRPDAEMPEDRRDFLGQLSTLLAFDFLINNPDRWTGGNAKVSEDGKTLYFMDNTLSFGPHPRAMHKVRLYLQRTQRFSRSLVERLRNLDRSVVVRAMAEDLGPFEILLTREEIDAMFSRRDILLAYIDELIEQHGEDRVLVFP